MNIEKKYGSFPSNDGIHKIHYMSICPKEPKAVIQIEHGIAEHIERYVGFASRLAACGYAVFADDHLGHGGSVESEDEYCWFAEKDGWHTVCRDVWALHDIAVKSFPNIPYVLMGHSMGSFIARTVAIEHSNDIDALVISGTGHQNGAVIAGGKLVCAIEDLRIGSKGRSNLVDKLAFSAYNKRFSPNRTEFDWLSRDAAEVDKYIADPLCGFKATVGIFSDMLDGLNIIRQGRYLKKMRSDLPVYILSGSADPVGSMGKGVKKVCSLLKKKAHISKLTLKLYESGRHELLNGPDRETVTEELIDWLDNTIC